MSTAIVMNRDQLCDVPADHRSAAGWRYRLATMAILWLGLGAVAGVGLARPNGGAISLMAAVVAGVVVLLPMGLFLGLIGGRWRETLFAAAAGHLLGFAASLLGASGSPRMLATQGLIFGGLLGATVVSVFYRLPKLVFARRTIGCS